MPICFIVQRSLIMKIHHIAEKFQNAVFNNAKKLHYAEKLHNTGKISS